MCADILTAQIYGTGSSRLANFAYDYRVYGLRGQEILFSAFRLRGSAIPGSIMPQTDFFYSGRFAYSRTDFYPAELGPIVSDHRRGSKPSFPIKRQRP